MVDRPPLYGEFVHVPCGAVHGYVYHYEPDEPQLYQSCGCEPREKWDADVSEKLQLCVLCARATAGGPSRWRHLACDDCRDAAQSFEPDPAFGLLLPLGRHSIMNGRFNRHGTEVEIASLVAMFPAQDQLFTWRPLEVRRLAAGLSGDVPLDVWLETFPSSPAASQDALARYYAAVVGGELA